MSQSEEGACAVEPEEEQPFSGEHASGHHHTAPFAAESCGAAEEEGCELMEVDEVGCHIDGNGIHADDDKEEGRAFESEDIDEEVEGRCEEQAPTRSDKDEGAGPDVLDDWEVLAPDGATGKECDSGEDQSERFDEA